MSIVAGNSLLINSLLVICPASMILSWRAELNKWSTSDFEVLCITKGTDLKKLPSTKITCVIVSYDTAKTKNAIKALTTGPRWDMLILDEAQKLKKRDTMRTKAILGPIWAKSRYRICLSGTPITDNVMDAYPTFAKIFPKGFANPEGIRHYWDFGNYFAEKESTAYGDKYYGIKNAAELRKIIRTNFFVRYTKEDVCPEMPSKTWSKIILPPEYSLKMKKSEEEMFKHEVEVIKNALEKGTPIPAVPATIAGVRKQQALHKLPPILEFIEDLLEQKLPVVVFTYHNDVLNRCKEYLNAFNPVTISGSTSAKERFLNVKAFQEDKSTNLFIGQIIAAGTGITLTRSHIVVLAENTWSPADIAQAVDRVHRIGTTKPVDIYYFSVENSIEERLLTAVMEKAKVIDAVLKREEGEE